MKKIFIPIVFIFLLIVTQCTDALGGAWTVPRYHYYIELYSKYYYAGYDFNYQGKRIAKGYEGYYDEYRIEFKFEWGIRDHINLWIAAPYKFAFYQNKYSKFKNRGIADTWLRIKYRIFEQPVVLSSMAGIKFSPYNINNCPSLGKGQTDEELKLLIGKSISWAYCGFEIGYRLRQEDPTNEIPYFLELGFQPIDRLMLKITLDGIEGISRTDIDEEDYTLFTISIIFKLKGIFNYIYRTGKGINLEFGYGNTFLGKNTSNGSHFYLNLALLI